MTVGDSPQDMRLGAEHGVPVRIGIDRDGDPRSLFAAGATHVVTALKDIVPIVARRLVCEATDPRSYERRATSAGHCLLI